MKKIFLLLLIFTSTIVVAQVNVKVNWLNRIPDHNSDTIYYNPQQKLVWSDFRGKPTKRDATIAITVSGFGYFENIQYRNGKIDISVEVYCYFNKSYSWVIPGGNSDYALNHEQHHFDVSFIAANLFVQKINQAVFNRKNYNILFDKIYNESVSELHKMQDDYDGQTSNGRIKEMQLVWNKKIENTLKIL